ncbi:UDP-N-acetylmuramate dehydrogenase [Cryomorpha ignava]|uniref:UDP-N-acetylenolpyruvoylglucosamine reductase n=1 Tax=Cryomorpha ignava TaxID=101383 RepID=A0A7K3WMK6_9FLAO|nr:UDP-N-acetylmuramate dehydrogenase [Cryomorpha ignava]NEN22879.1 UDP-N-acetylmuramate dehydrogenase [Cryomorpha ignava]
MQIERNASLKALNTFGIEAKAAFLATFHSADELRLILESTEIKNFPKMILGGGSNLLFTQDYDGLILKNGISGIECIREDEDHFYVKAGAGENWHDFVLTCIKNGYAGIENLSLIPGNVGASPMQNIGAYGVEIKDRFDHLEAFNLETGDVEIFSGEECEFGYRESVFKRKLKGKYVIVSVTFQLLKKPDFQVKYGAITTELEEMGVKELSIEAISQAVINIRNSKLPNPKDLGNAGSFFKNPVISAAQWKKISAKHPEIPNYPAPENEIKLAAGWLIEQAGWKGKRIGNCGMHAKQALVLVNYGGATGQEIYDHSTRVKESVAEQFGVELEREVNIL